jgi:hypothetical protein
MSADRLHLLPPLQKREPRLLENHHTGHSPATWVQRCSLRLSSRPADHGKRKLCDSNFHCKSRRLAPGQRSLCRSVGVVVVHYQQMQSLGRGMAFTARGPHPARCGTTVAAGVPKQRPAALAPRCAALSSGADQQRMRCSHWPHRSCSNATRAPAWRLYATKQPQRPVMPTKVCTRPQPHAGAAALLSWACAGCEPIPCAAAGFPKDDLQPDSVPWKHVSERSHATPVSSRDAPAAKRQPRISARRNTLRAPGRARPPHD